MLTRFDLAGTKRAAVEMFGLPPSLWGWADFKSPFNNLSIIKKLFDITIVVTYDPHFH